MLFTKIISNHRKFVFVFNVLLSMGYVLKNHNKPYYSRFPKCCRFRKSYKLTKVKYS